MLTANKTIRIEAEPRAADRIRAMLGALGYKVEIVDTMPAMFDRRLEEIAEGLSETSRATLLAMLVTDDAHGLARMLGIAWITANSMEAAVCNALGIRGRLDLLRMLVGVDSAATKDFVCEHVRHEWRREEE